LESELFGNVKGAFTGADRNKKGKFEEAQGGTIFLDDINCASLNCQVKLLRILQERTFERVGGNESLSTDVRIITATNTPLLVEVENKKFREDLYHRINVVSLAIPPLRERLGDIEPLIEYFIKRFNEAHNRKVKGISNSALQLCYNYHWPGNVRQLENVLERAIILSQGDFIIPESLPEEVRNVTTQTKDIGNLSLSVALADAEKRILFKCLKQHNWNRQITAQVLGISRTTLFNKMRQYQIDDPRKINESLLQ
jgi:two-component system response regulator AtoC